MKSYFAFFARSSFDDSYLRFHIGCLKRTLLSFCRAVRNSSALFFFSLSSPYVYKKLRLVFGACKLAVHDLYFNFDFEYNIITMKDTIAV